MATLDDIIAHSAPGKREPHMGPTGYSPRFTPLYADPPHSATTTHDNLGGSPSHTRATAVTTSGTTMSGGRRGSQSSNHSTGTPVHIPVWPIPGSGHGTGGASSSLLAGRTPTLMPSTPPRHSGHGSHMGIDSHSSAVSSRNSSRSPSRLSTPTPATTIGASGGGNGHHRSLTLSASPRSRQSTNGANNIVTSTVSPGAGPSHGSFAHANAASGDTTPNLQRRSTMV
jgi:hypothetical protein